MEDMTHYFVYELSPEHTSLFKDGFMQKANKSALDRSLTKKAFELELEVLNSTKYVLDEETLLHRVCWNIPATY